MRYWQKEAANYAEQADVLRGLLTEKARPGGSCYFLQDFTKLLYERAKESKERCKSAHERLDNTASHDFECGRALAYYEVLSTFVHQAEIFDIPGDLIGLTNIDPDQLLS